ncbi:MAG: hypothetical protein IPL83_00625 [Bdellovibrionales bacterium]|nr:hypothetical protein [Bdellovibrionales bacterium]
MKYLVFLALFALVSCSKKGNDSPAPASPISPRMSWTFKGVFGGYVPSIVFHPSKPCEVWASGDDMSGLYKSTDCGSSWQLISSPKNVSSYSLTFDPTNSAKMYAVSHFGWGMLKSTDGGITWSLSQSGLPSSGTNKHVYQMAINPTLASTIVVATDDGLYRSTDSGDSFSKLSIAWSTAFKAVVYDFSGRLFAGATNGVLKYSDDNGTTWSDLVTGAVPISKLAVSAHALYTLFADATLMYTTLPSLGSSVIVNNPASAITTGLQTVITVVSGNSQAADTIFLGTSKIDSVASSRWGLFKSSNGGTSWVQMGSALSGHSIFSVAIDPSNYSVILVGSTNSSGVFKTTDGGSNWAASSSGLMANAVLGFAQNPLNPRELVMSSTVGLGLGQSYSSTDEGATWSAINEVSSADGVVAWSFDPSNSGVVLAGMIGKGLYRSSSGVNGPWTRVVNTDVKIDRIVRDNSSSSVLYALARAGSLSSDIRVYYSADGGASFAKRTFFFAGDLATHPTNLNEAAMVSTNDGFVSTDGFLTGHSLGLSVQSSAQGGMTAIAFNPSNSSELWVGGISGGLFKTTNYNNMGSGISWKSVNSPISNALVQKIYIRNESGGKAVYVSSFGADVYFSSGAALGLWKSFDDGVNWTDLSSSLYPCTSFWGFYPVAGSTTDFWGAMWGGGLFRLSYQ